MQRFWLAIGWLTVAAAFAGVWMPLVPTVPFLLVALWAFTRGSPDARRWLLEHPRFGPSLQAWQEHGAIPWHGKLLSAVGMAGSFLILVFTTELPLWVLVVVGLLFLAIGAYVCTRPAPAECR